MWAITNRTSYAAERTWVRDKHGVHHWIVAVRATFDVGEDGSLKLADEQPPPVRAAEYFGEPGKSSVRYEADLGPMKPGTDVTVLGSAYAPGGRPAERVPVSLRVGKLHKVLVVHGDRVYYEGASGLACTRAAPFVKKAIRYEDAFGGMDLTDPDPSRHAYDGRNPIGRGFAVRSATLAYTPAHSIEYPEGSPSHAGPAGFGPIASYWTPRLEHAGTYDDRWTTTKKPLLPDDYDERFTLCAPVDQRPIGKYLYGGDLVELVHLTEGGVLRLSLPKIYLTFQTRVASERHEHRSRLVSVILEPDNRSLAMVWQTSLKVPARKVEHLDEVVIREKPYVA